MTKDEAATLAQEWLLKQGYTYFADGVLSWQGEEAAADAALALYIYKTQIPPPK